MIRNKSKALSWSVRHGLIVQVAFPEMCHGYQTRASQIISASTDSWRRENVGVRERLAATTLNQKVTHGFITAISLGFTTLRQTKYNGFIHLTRTVLIIQILLSWEIFKWVFRV
jgi:hypothetical protein